MADNEARLPRERVVRTRAVMRSFPDHEDCVMCPHPVFEKYYEDTGEAVTTECEPPMEPFANCPKCGRTLYTRTQCATC